MTTLNWINPAGAKWSQILVASAPLLLTSSMACAQVESNQYVQAAELPFVFEAPVEENVAKLIDRERDEMERANAAFEAGEIEEVTGQTVASFTLSNGNTVRFVAVPEDKEVAVIEVVPEGSVSVLQRRQESPLATYVALAPPDVSIPRALAITASPDEAQELLRDRSIAVKPIAEAYVDVERMELTAPAQAAAGVGYCTPTPAGALYFTLHSCKSENLQTSFCDPGSFISNWNWTTLIRQSSVKKRNSYGRTAACGGTAIAEHYYWSGVSGKWKYIKGVNIGANSQVWKRHSGASWPKRYRRIRHMTFHPNLGGFIRAWSEFHD